MRERLNVRKAAVYSVVINAVQIVAVGAISLLVLLTDIENQSALFVELIICLAAAVIIWGAVVDIQQAFSVRQTALQADMLEAAYGNLEALNITLRAQRHDFMNHLQVVGSLLEMEEHAEAKRYIETIYGEIQTVASALLTANPAVNALLKLKLGECQGRGIFLDLRVLSKWEPLPIQSWEMCRVLGNLIDNSIDALAGVQDARITVSLYEEQGAYRFTVENNGPPISDQDLPRLFQRGFTTKGRERGMGLFIVRSILLGGGGDIAASSSHEKTSFHGFLPIGQNMEEGGAEKPQG